MERAFRHSRPILRPSISMPPAYAPTGSHYDYPPVPISQNYIDYSQRMYGGVYHDDDFSWMDSAVGYQASQVAPVRQIRPPRQLYDHQQQTQLSQWSLSTFQEPRFTQRLPPPTYRPVRPATGYPTKPAQLASQRPSVAVKTSIPRGPRPPVPAAKTVPPGRKEADQPPSKIRKVNPHMPMLPPPKTSGKVVVSKPAEIEAPSHPLRSTRILTGSIPKILRWNGGWMAVQQKRPKADGDLLPLFLTVGRLIGFWGGKDCHRTETRFLLEDLPHFSSGNRISLKLHCTYFAIDRPFETHSIGTTLRCIGVFTSDRGEKKKTVFQCVAMRPAEESDIRFVATREDKVQSMIDQKLI